MRSAFDLQSYTLRNQDGMQGLQVLSINVLLLQISGIWPSGLKKQTLFHKCCTVLHISIYIYGICGCTAYLLLESKGINEVVERISVWLTLVKHVVKLTVFLLNREKIISLIYRAEQNFFIHGPTLNTQDKTGIILVAKKVRQITLGFCVLVALTAILYIVHPFVKYFVDGSTIDGERFLHPFQHKFFFDLKKSPLYEIEWFIDVFGCFLVSYCTAATDTFAAALCLYLTCQFQMLGSSLRESARNIKLRLERGHSYKARRAAVPKKGSYKPMSQNHAISNEILKQQLDLFEENNDQNMEKFHREMHQYIVECIQHHQSLLQYMDDVNDSLGCMFFSDFLVTTILTCVLEYWLIVTEDRGLEFVKAILHLTCLITQFLFYNYLSSELAFVSEEVSTAAYDSEWYQQNVSYQRTLRMLIMRAQKPVGLSALNFTGYSLSIFASVMQRSYSCLAVMRNFHQSMEVTPQ